MKHCLNCKKNIKPVKSPFSWGWFFVWWLVGAIPYVFYHIFKPKNRCPICGLKGLGRAEKITS